MVNYIVILFPFFSEWIALQFGEVFYSEFLTCGRTGFCRLLESYGRIRIGLKKERFWYTSIVFENDFKFKWNESIFLEKCVEQLIFCEASEIVTDILKHLYLNVVCPHHECKDQQGGATPWTVIPNTNIDLTRLRNLRDLRLAYDF